MRIRQWSAFGAVLTATALLACAGQDAAEEPAETTEAAAPVEQPAAAAPEPGGALPAGVTQEMVAAGQQVFTTQTCYTCHGMDGTGTPLAPNLTDSEWINTDGTLEGIEDIVRNGVPTPQQHPAAMPPMGGAQLTDDQIRSVSAYVFSLSNGA